jgi:hypothetical protein
MNEQERLFEQQMKGYCCSQAIMALALEDMDMDNEDIVAASAAFCGGMRRGKICGSLAAAAMALHLRDPERAAEWQAEFMEWFEGEYGSCDCDGIIGGDPVRRAQTCPSLILGTYMRLREYIL